MPTIHPVYIETFRSGELEKKTRGAYDILRSCTLCPRKCRVDRLSGKTGICNTGDKAFVSSYNAHYGEEAPLVGKHGSGTIFFTHCNLMCSFCQNYDISHEGHGDEVTDAQLAHMMIELQNAGCHNINFVTPSHVVPQLLSALEIAISYGLTIPLVYNSGGYDSPETLRLLKGAVDIYMPDFKFWDPEIAKKTCDAGDYPEAARNALKEMHRQVGDLQINDAGIAWRGLLIRHLVLPQGLAGTEKVMHFIAEHLSADSYVNIMTQYRPCGKAAEIPALLDGIPQEAFEKAAADARAAGIKRLDKPRSVFML
jgi:putative pyruvate formate lyase activating enzyme